jgi:hypothetical protein
MSRIAKVPARIQTAGTIISLFLTYEKFDNIFFTAFTDFLSAALFACKDTQKLRKQTAEIGEWRIIVGERQIIVCQRQLIVCQRQIIVCQRTAGFEYVL